MFVVLMVSPEPLLEPLPVPVELLLAHAVMKRERAARARTADRILVPVCLFFMVASGLTNSPPTRRVTSTFVGEIAAGRP
jgi:hypothetical protein